MLRKYIYIVVERWDETLLFTLVSEKEIPEYQSNEKSLRAAT